VAGPEREVHDLVALVGKVAAHGDRQDEDEDDPGGSFVFVFYISGGSDGFLECGNGAE
jgi:hypothetical protein